MDEKKLSDLFNDAVRDVPPATFGTGEVRKASHRVAARRRNTVVAASALAFALVAGGTVTTIALSGGNADPTAANAPALAGGPPPTGGTMYPERRDAPFQEQVTPYLDGQSDAPKQGGDTTGNAGTAGSTPRGCQADQGLAAALAGELLAASSREDVGVPFACPDGALGEAYQVTDGTRSGTISVVLTAPGVASLGSEVHGTVNAQSETRNGSVIHIVSQPNPAVQPAEAPFADTIATMATHIAAKY